MNLLFSPRQIHSLIWYSSLHKLFFLTKNHPIHPVKRMSFLPTPRMVLLPPLSKTFSGTEENKHHARASLPPLQCLVLMVRGDLRPEGLEESFYFWNRVWINLVNLEPYPILSQIVVQLFRVTWILSLTKYKCPLCKSQRGFSFFCPQYFVEFGGGFFLFCRRIRMMSLFHHF